jgi:hypothetical protein
VMSRLLTSPAPTVQQARKLPAEKRERRDKKLPLLKAPVFLVGQLREDRFLTEDVYNGRKVRPNLDIMHGQVKRASRHSGVLLDRPAFSVQTHEVLEIPCPETNSLMRTCLIEGGGKRPFAIVA